MAVDGRFRVGDVLQGPQEAIMAETAIFSLGEIAIASEQVENDVKSLDHLNGIRKMFC